MVTVELIGGLGNQLFQVAACIAYAKRHNLPFHIPTDTKNSHSSKPYFSCENPNYDPLLPTIIYQEPFFHYQQIPAGLHEPGKNLILKGYFQSYKYFEDIDKLEFAHILNSTFQKRTEIPLLPSIKKAAIHVRRGDYLLYPDKHPIIDIDYLSSAIEFMKRSGIKDFVFYSDDEPWCCQVAKQLGIDCTIEMIKDPMQAFAALSNYDFYILSNSTFGYWAAIVRELWKKSVSQAIWVESNVMPPVVIYPQKWFGPGYFDLKTDDMCPPYWIKM